MGKLAMLASVTSAPLDTFVFMPPDAALKAARVLVLANLGYAIGAAPALNWGTLAAVLRGLRRASPHARLLITDKICPSSSAEAVFAHHGLQAALDAEMRTAATDSLLRREYTNPLPSPYQQAVLTAPEALADFDCVIAIGVFEARLSGVRGMVSLLDHLLPCDASASTLTGSERHHDTFFTLSPCINAAILEVPISRSTTRILVSNDLLALDETACSLTQTPTADYIAAIRATRRTLL